ncbi:hypothetical protein N7451_007094 [Penicillium sp. IBT 35674x]|nr:hypothetical protein N7451_007094 [Penicillium sp. IBT 35674x]
MATAIVDSVNAPALGVSPEPSGFKSAADSNLDSPQTGTSTSSSSLSSDATKNGQPSKTEDDPQNAQLNEKNEAEPPLEDVKVDPFYITHWNRTTMISEQRSLQERIQDVPARLFHEALLHRLFHDRLEALEDAILGPKKLDSSSYNKSRIPDSEATTKWLTWQEYSVVYDVPDSKGEWKHVPEIDNSPQSVIEILIEEPLSFRAARSVTTKHSPGVVAGSKANVDGKQASLPMFQIRLRSPILLKVLNEVTDQLSQRGPHEHKVTFMRPFKLLTLFWKELLEHQKKLEQIHGDSTAERQDPSTTIGPFKETESPKALEHLRLLNEFMANHLGRVFNLREEFEKGTARKVAFRDLWHLFRPGTTVRTPAAKQIQLYRVIRVTGGRPIYSLANDAPPNYAGVKLKDQGYSLGSFIVECFYIDFDGTQYGPVNRTFQIRKYEGERDLTALPVYPLQCDPNHESIREEMVTRGENFAGLSNPEKTAHKQYRGLTLDKHPEQVESQGKGKGLIILLHGEPGVGKTSTAECVADHTKRPLFPVTCGDIGDNAEFVEKNLERNFQLAHKWGCVLLLDEADVFLKRRNDTDLPRNAIVSVFLRTLEYYSGILFLTTNRVGQIDRAFKSRIHVSLYYPKLDKKTSIQIWKNNIGRIRKEFKAQNPDFDIREKEIIQFAKEHFKDIKDKKLLNWNGRQIRNAFQTAVALAAFDARKNKRPNDIILGKEQFTRVAAAAEEFDRYLQSLSQGKNDSQLAEEHRWRADNFQNQPMVVPMVPNTDPGRSLYAFGQSSRSSKGRGPEKGVYKEAQLSETDSDSSTSSDKEDSNEPYRQHDESDESSDSESDLVSSEEDRKKKRKGKSTSKTKDGKKRSSHKESK